MEFIIKLLLQNAKDFSRKKSTLGMEKNYNKIYSSIANTSIVLAFKKFF